MWHRSEYQTSSKFFQSSEEHRLIVIIRVNVLIPDDTNSAELAERPLSASSGHSLTVNDILLHPVDEIFRNGTRLTSDPILKPAQIHVRFATANDVGNRFPGAAGHRPAERTMPGVEIQVCHR